MPLAWATLTALVGGLIWSLLPSAAWAWIGWPALPLGCLVGYVGRRTGGRGKLMSIGCVFLVAAASVISWQFQNQLTIQKGAFEISQVDFDRYRADAQRALEWSQLGTEDERAGFRAKHGIVAGAIAEPDLSNSPFIHRPWPLDFDAEFQTPEQLEMALNEDRRYTVQTPLTPLILCLALGLLIVVAFTVPSLSLLRRLGDRFTTEVS